MALRRERLPPSPHPLLRNRTSLRCPEPPPPLPRLRARAPSCRCFPRRATRCPARRSGAPPATASQPLTAVKRVWPLSSGQQALQVHPAGLASPSLRPSRDRPATATGHSRTSCCPPDRQSQSSRRIPGREASRPRQRRKSCCCQFGAVVPKHPPLQKARDGSAAGRRERFACAAASLQVGGACGDERGRPSSPSCCTPRRATCP
mmetsp:Transcript_10303/g.21167  ORF Transcript_10303/g.21167 Transcript_10303/m.21167 type:complete len:205 (-) Transcript_10303:812-1426(-)